VWVKRFIETTGLSFRKNLDKQLCQCLGVQEQFLRDHLCVWIPQFCERVLEISTSKFYTEMGKLTKSVVMSDAQQINAAQTALQCSSFAGRIQQNFSLQ
jgi:TorA maturation chaperone TorD